MLNPQPRCCSSLYSLVFQSSLAAIPLCAAVMQRSWNVTPPFTDSSVFLKNNWLLSLLWRCRSAFPQQREQLAEPWHISLQWRRVEYLASLPSLFVVYPEEGLFLPRNSWRLEGVFRGGVCALKRNTGTVLPICLSAGIWNLIKSLPLWHQTAASPQEHTQHGGGSAEGFLQQAFSPSCPAAQTCLTSDCCCFF